jgi:predicted deacetylase
MKLLLRFDDYSELSNASLDMRIIETIVGADCKVLVGVVPAVAELDWAVGSDIPLRRLSRERARILREIVPHGVEIAMHGYTHQTITRWSGLAEFGDAVSLQRQTERLLDGKNLLEDLFGCEIAWFVPPWNSYSTTTLQALKTSGFRGISADASFGPLEDGLSYAPASCLPRELPLAAKRAKVDAAAAIITVMHDYDFLESRLKTDALSLKTFASMLTAVKTNKTEDSGFSDILGHTDFNMERALANQKLHQYASSPVRYLMPSGIVSPYWSVGMADRYARKMARIEGVAKKILHFYRKTAAR